MKLSELVDTSRRISETSRRLAKAGLLAELLRRSSPGEAAIVIAYLSGDLPQGKIGLGYATLRDALARPPASAGSLELGEVDIAFDRIAAASGKGSAAIRARLLGELLALATEPERDFLFRLAIGELRQGSLEGIMAEAIARATGTPPEKVRRAAMLSGDLAAVGRVALERGEAGLAEFDVRLFRPLAPMLASPSVDVGEALDTLGTAALEYKLDGARVQLHKAGGEVRVYTRSLKDVTPAVPELVEIAARIPAREVILDGEALALGPDGTPRPFQVTMRRLGRKLDVAALRDDLPITPFFFDCLYLDGRGLIDSGGQERFAALAGVTPEEFRIPRIVTADRAAAEQFAAAALGAGHEGIMAKALSAAYEAGNRGNSWLKVKRAHTLDLVVLAAEWGHGRRRGWLSNLHLGARSPDSGTFVMLGKTFKGLTDAMLAWQTERLLELEIGRDDFTVHVRPELVVEIAFNEIQASPHYPGGMALRFARVKAHRPEKRAAEADTIETVRALFERRR